jgi:cytochrome c551/c552
MLKQVILIYRIIVFTFIMVITSTIILFSLESNNDNFYCGVESDREFCGLRSNVYPNFSPSGFRANKTGNLLVENNCLSCHAYNEIIVGPPLNDIFDKNRDLKWLRKFIKNSKKLIDSKDPLAVEVFNEYGKQYMPSFNLSDNEIDSILADIQFHSDVVY